jgi:hypothetical protein
VPLRVRLTIEVRRSAPKPGRLAFRRWAAFFLLVACIGAEMTSEQTADRARETSGSYGDLFRSASEADAASKPQAAPDESEAAMTRLRAPFEVGPVDVVEQRT